LTIIIEKLYVFELALLIMKYANYIGFLFRFFSDYFPKVSCEDKFELSHRRKHHIIELCFSFKTRKTKFTISFFKKILLFKTGNE
jgi:hypothetical protein